jgi:LysM repeat protein
MAYKIQPGDSMTAIAQRHGVSLAALEKANPQVRDPNQIRAGSSLTIPGKSDSFQAPGKAGASAKRGGYTVRSGDTMSGIAARSNVSLRALKAANPQVKNANLITVGQRLTIPQGGDTFSQPSKGSSKSTTGTSATTGTTGAAAPTGQKVPGNVGQWISQAQKILAANGVPASKMNASDIAMIIQHESSGNPNAQNNWDSNAKAGHPSIGLMQTIGPTFNAYKLPGHDNIRNPVDNIIAGVRYAISRYGSISNVPGVKKVHAGGAYVGY